MEPTSKLLPGDEPKEGISGALGGVEFSVVALGPLQ